MSHRCAARRCRSGRRQFWYCKRTRASVVTPSVPHEQVGERLLVKVSQTLVQVWHKGALCGSAPMQRPAVQSYDASGAHAGHHRGGHSSWTPEKLLDNAARTGHSAPGGEGDAECVLRLIRTDITARDEHPLRAEADTSS